MKNPWKKYSKINPQRENGHREIANDVYYALLSANFTGAEYKIILAIIDKTWGFGKDNDSIAIGQFAKMTNLSGRTIQRTLKKLHRLRVVYLSPFGRRVSTGSPLNKYSFNKHYDTWKVEGCQIVQGCQLGHPPKASKGDIHGRIRVTPGPPTKETITKETITKEIYTSNSIEFRLANYLFNNILKNSPNHKKPNLQKWAKDIDLMIRIDNRCPDKIKKVIEWCQNDTPDKQKNSNWKGWAGNILSAKKLRLSFDQLFIKMQECNFKPKYDPLTNHNLNVVGKFLKKEGVI